MTHNIELESSVLIAPVVPVLDLLDGDSTSNNGLPRHSSRLEAGIFRDGTGLRISGRYTGKTRVDGSGLPASNDVFFGDIATVNIRLFVNLGRLLKQENGVLKNMRLSLRANNLFDAQRRIVDSTGAVPQSFQTFLVDPLGRSLRIELRRMF